MHQQQAINEDNFLTLSRSGSGLYKEKGSKFIAYAQHVESVEDALAFVNELKTKYHDARHFCFGYRIDPKSPQVRANDDGEPSNSAGAPIYNQLVSSELWNTIVVVIRYFGGTKLGVSGLITAYKEAARLAIENSKIKRVYICKEVEIEFPYPLMNDIMRLIKDMDLEIAEERMALKAGYLLRVREDNYFLLLNKLESMHEVVVY